MLNPSGSLRRLVKRQDCVNGLQEGGDEQDNGGDEGDEHPGVP